MNKLEFNINKSRSNSIHISVSQHAKMVNYKWWIFSAYYFLYGLITFCPLPMHRWPFWWYWCIHSVVLKMTWNLLRMASCVLDKIMINFTNYRILGSLVSSLEPSARICLIVHIFSNQWKVFFIVLISHKKNNNNNNIKNI